MDVLFPGQRTDGGSDISRIVTVELIRNLITRFLDPGGHLQKSPSDSK